MFDSKFIKFNLLLFVVLPALIILLARIPLFQNYELTLYDFRLQLRPQLETHHDIAIIEIDDETLQNLGSWPLPRDFHASFVDVLAEAGAKAVIFDILFSEPAAEDAFFSQSLEKAGNVYLPQVFDLPLGKSVGDFLHSSVPVRIPITKSLEANMRGSGHINTLVDLDGKIRRVPLFIKNEKNELVSQMGLRMACVYQGLDCGKVRFSSHEVIVDEKLRIPVADENEVMVNYPGLWKNSFHHYSYFEILKAHQLWKETGSDKGVLHELKGKVCFVGTTAVGTVDIRATPLESNYPMLGLHASLFNSFIQNEYIRRMSVVVNDAINLALFALALFVSIRLAPVVAFFATISLALVFFLTATLLLDGFGIWINVFFPVVLILTTYLGATLWRWFGDIRERLVLEREMQVASDLQNQFLIQPDQKADNLDVAQWFKPAKFVAGDLFDVFKIDESKAGLLLGDVSGKGLPAALLMSQAISSFRIFSRQISEPHDVFYRLNNVLASQNSGRFLTAMYCVVDVAAKTVRVCSAGQGPLLIYRYDSKQVEVIEFPGKTPLGLMPDMMYKTQTFDLRFGDKLVLFSDGVSEARNDQKIEFGQDNIITGILESADMDCAQTLEGLKRKLEIFTASNNIQHDDITLIVAAFRDNLQSQRSA